MQTESLSTQSGPSSKADWLQGQHVTVWPYARGYYPRDMAYRVWRMIEQERAWSSLCWGRFPTLNSDKPIDERCDLQEFIEIFARVGKSQFFIVSDPMTDSLAGFMWCEDIVERFKGTVSIIMRQRYWGDPAREAARIGIRFLFDKWDLQELWTMTPWRAAVEFDKSIGFKSIAVLPGYMKIKDKQKDIHILRLKRKDWANG